MPALDIFHDQVKNALIKDGWTITDDPLKIEWRNRKLFIDLGAERLLGAEKAERKIAVEVKSFVGKSDIADLEVALGQFTLYEILLEETEPEKNTLSRDSQHCIRFGFQQIAWRASNRAESLGDPL